MATTERASVLSQALQLLDSVYKHTAYEDKCDAQQTFMQLRIELQRTAASAEGQKLIQKFDMLARTVSTEGTFNDMVKIIWRVAKGMGGTIHHKFSLLVIGVSIVCVSLTNSRPVEDISSWTDRFVKWLGKQLTTGGKGAVGEGEGSVGDRMQRFFTNPYLHDFD